MKRRWDLQVDRGCTSEHTTEGSPEVNIDAMPVKKKVDADRLIGFSLVLALLACHVSPSYSTPIDREKGSNHAPFFIVDDFEYNDSPLDQGWVPCSESTDLRIVFDEDLNSRVSRIRSTPGTEGRCGYAPGDSSLNIDKPYLSAKVKPEAGFVFEVKVSGVDADDLNLSYTFSDPAAGGEPGAGEVRLPGRFQDGKWHFLERDLASDLLDAFGVELESVKEIYVSGSGYLDEVKLYLFDREFDSLSFRSYECAPARYLETSSRYSFVEGVLQTDYGGEIGCQYQPVDIALYGLACWNSFRQTGDSSWVTKFLTQADYFVTERFDVGPCSVLRYDFSVWNFKVPWISAMAQGLVLSFLSRAFVFSGDQRFLNVSDEVFRSFGVNLEEGGVRDMLPDGNVWYPEYPEFPDGRRYVLNGFVVALQGLHDYHLLTKKEQARVWLDQGVEALKANIDRFDAGRGSFYDLTTHFLNSQNSYHKLHIALLRQLHEITGQTIFSKWRWIFDNYTSNTFEYDDSPFNHNWGSSGEGGEVQVIWDDSLKSRVMKMSGNSKGNFRIVYPKGEEDLNIDRNLVSWKLKSEGTFLVSFTVETASGLQYELAYKRSKDALDRERAKILISLDQISFEDDRWHLVERDLGRDLREATGEDFRHLVCVRLSGNLCFDDLRLVRDMGQVIDDFQYVDSPLDHGWMICDGTGDMLTTYDDSIRSTVLMTTTGESTNTNFCVRYPREDIKLCRSEDFLHLKIKDQDDFVIYVLVRATDGKDYYLRYQPGEGQIERRDKYVFIPVGSFLCDGSWHEIVRNLSQDIYAGTGAHYEYSTSLVLRGDLRVDDITFSHLRSLGNPGEDTVSGWTSDVRLLSRFHLEQNYPNPFNQGTIIRFGLAQDGDVSVKLFNILGRQVKVLINGRLSPGTHQIEWKGDDDNGNPVASGIYFCTLRSGSSFSCNKVMLLR